MPLYLFPERGINASAVFAMSNYCAVTEDAGRSDLNFLTQVLAVAIEAGATTVNIPDTVGFNLPHHYGSRIKYLMENTPGADKVVFSTHTHNDLGLATANALAGIQNGARQVGLLFALCLIFALTRWSFSFQLVLSVVCGQCECTVNGIGERAGNTSLEEIVMALYLHGNVRELEKKFYAVFS